MSPQERQHFDRLLEEVLQHIPQQVLDLMDEVPIIVEDHPSRQVCEEMNLEYRDELCGMFRGIAVTEPERERGRQHSDQVLLFREGILSAAMDAQGRGTWTSFFETRGSLGETAAREILDDEIRRQIRITILHEYGHHFGLDEDMLEDLGYG